jgi:hypothetical protein
MNSDGYGRVGFSVDPVEGAVVAGLGACGKVIVGVMLRNVLKPTWCDLRGQYYIP